MAVIFGNWRPPGADTGKSGILSPETVTDARGVLKLAEEHGLFSFPLDVVELAKRMGIVVVNEELDEHISGKLCHEESPQGKASPGIWKIYLNKLQTEQRRRFTLAHELAHFVLHRGKADVFEDDVFYRSEVSNLEEWQANRFAGELLMPKEEVKLFLRENGGCNMEDIARHFDVSTIAARVRLKQLS